MAAAVADLSDELRKMGATNTYITCNALLGRNGNLLSQQRVMDDPGVVLYATLDGKDHIWACDQSPLFSDNLRAVGLTVKATRDIARWSTQMADAMLSGFAALPERLNSQSNWYDVLNLEPGSRPTLEQLEAAYRRQMKKAHPDAGGSHEAVIRVTQAYEEGKREIETDGRIVNLLRHA